MAALFTREFYAEVLQRLNSGGLFMQWLQAYEIDGRSFRTTVATLHSVFEHVEIWQTRAGDMVFVCAAQPLEYEADVLRAKIATEPFRSAMLNVWHTADLDCVLAHYLAGPALVDAVAAAPNTPCNTDDRNVLEYGMARTLGRQGLFSVAELREAAHRLTADQPPIQGDVDWDRVYEERLWAGIAAGEPVAANIKLSAERQLRLTAWYHYLAGRMQDATAAWEAQPAVAATIAEQRLLAHAYAEAGNEMADLWIARLSPSLPTDAELLSAILAARGGQPDRAVDRLIAAFERLRAAPWPEDLAQRGLTLARELSVGDRRRADRLRAALETPFAVRLLESQRLASKLAIAESLPDAVQLQDYLDFEPHVPWTGGFLRQRRNVYRATDNPLAATAESDLKAFLRSADDTAVAPDDAQPPAR